MKRILVIGCPGGGKSTFARALNETTSIPLVHLDLLYWNADKTTVSKEVLLARVQDALTGEAWIIDGNYGSTLEMRLQAADTVFLLDYPTEVCLAGLAERIGKARPDMPWVEAADTTDYAEFVEYVKGFRASKLPNILALLERYPEKSLYVFHERQEADAFLKQLSDQE